MFANCLFWCIPSSVSYTIICDYVLIFFFLLVLRLEINYRWKLRVSSGLRAHALPVHSHNFLNSIAYVLLLNALIFQEIVSLAYGWCSIVCLNYNILPQQTIVVSIMCVFVFEECFLLHSEFQLGEVISTLYQFFRQSQTGQNKHNFLLFLNQGPVSHIRNVGCCLWDYHWAKLGYWTRENKNALKLSYGFPVPFLKNCVCLFAVNLWLFTELWKTLVWWF